MRWIVLTTGLLAIFIVATFEVSRGQTTAPTTAPAARKRVLYTPPPRGAPDTRWGGGSRGAAVGNAPALAVLLPPTTGHTVSAHPSLFWFISSVPERPCEMAISDPDTMDTLIRVPLSVTRAGIQRIDLDPQKVNLKAGVEYRWSVNFVADKEGPKRTPAHGDVMRIEPPSGLAKRLGETRDPRERAAAYAQEGFWCDALTTLGDAIDANPTDRSLREQRAELLNEVGLAEAAAAELGADRAGP
jgi:hypothetical protein